jgi:hypothetical protein
MSPSSRNRSPCREWYQCWSISCHSQILRPTAVGGCARRPTGALRCGGLPASWSASTVGTCPRNPWLI